MKYDDPFLRSWGDIILGAVYGIVGTIILAAIIGALFAGRAYPQPPAERRLVGVREQQGEFQYPLDPASVGVTLPRVLDGPLDRIIHDPRTIFYRLSQTYQQFVPAGRIEHRDLALGTSHFTSRPAVWGIYAASYLHEFNANGDFPWESTFGLNTAHRAGKVGPRGTYDVLNFLALPSDDAGRLVPVLVLADERPIKWIFPTETTVGEVIFVRHAGRAYVQEIRTRTKSKDAKTWHPSVYRPVRNRSEYQSLVGQAYEPAKRHVALRNPEEDEVFAVSGTCERLPALDVDRVADLLSRPFQDVTAENWSPAADQDFHILPKDYTLGLLGAPDSKACANCHRQTQISVRNLIPREPLIADNPMKVGNIRGSDAVFTWHPFDTRSISDPGNDNVRVVPDRTIYTRKFDADNRIVELVRRGQSPSHGPYKITKFVQDSLHDYELPSEVAYLHPAPLRKGQCDCAQCPCSSATGAQCKCALACDCPEPTKGKWQPLRDNRIVVPVGASLVGEGKSASPVASVVGVSFVSGGETSSSSTSLSSGAGAASLRWVKQDSDYYLRDDRASKWLGYYSSGDHLYRVFTRSLANGDLVVGGTTAPPIAIPEGAR